jgi:hypothetical protein
MRLRSIFASLTIIVSLSAVASAAPTSARTLHRAVQSAHVQAPLRACSSTGYSSNCGGCVTVSASGKYTVKVPKTTVTFKGSKAAKGARVCFSKVATPMKAKGGVGVRVTATKKLGSAKPSKKKDVVYLFHAATKSLTKVKTITKAGIYQVVS